VESFIKLRKFYGGGSFRLIPSSDALIYAKKLDINQFSIVKKVDLNQLKRLLSRLKNGLLIFRD
jgi:hypothetical protein